MDPNDWALADRQLEEPSAFRTPLSAHSLVYRPVPVSVAHSGPFMTSDLQSLLPFSGGQLPSPTNSVNIPPHHLPPLASHPPPIFFRHPPPPGPAGSFPVYMAGSPAMAGIPTPDSSPYSARSNGATRQAAAAALNPTMYQSIPPLSGRPLQQPFSAILAPAPTISPPRSRHATVTPSHSRLPTPSGTADQQLVPAAQGARAWSYSSSREPSARPDAESLRPEYLVRASREDSPPFDRFVDEPVKPGMGITVSPMKGRRITLFQETSEESFEQSLMAGGYGKYGTNPDRTALGTSAASQMHQRTLEWLEQAQAQVAPKSTLAAPVAVTAKAPSPPVQEKEPDAKELLKRKRLAAFKEVPYMPSKLRVVEVEDTGRMLLEVPNIEPDFPADDSKKKPKKAKKKVPPPPPPKPVEIEETKCTGWVDNAFPWSLRASERAEGVRKEQSERLKWIERYLERESDESDVSDDEDADLPSPILPAATLEAYDDDAGAHLIHKSSFRMGGPAGNGRFVVPGETTDARWQLTNAALRLRAASGRGEGDADLGRDCVCGGRGASDLVQCDDCHRWCHMACLGIGNVAELGGEAEPWYCHLCTGAPTPVPMFDRRRTPSPVPLHREPAFYTAQQTPQAPRPELISFALPFQDSPMLSWPSSLSAPPTTPLYTRGMHLGTSTVHSSRSTATTVLQTPRSIYKPRDVRVMGGSPPDPFDEPFDPTATPSRPDAGWAARGSSVPWARLSEKVSFDPSTSRVLAPPGVKESALVHSASSPRFN